MKNQTIFSKKVFFTFLLRKIYANRKTEKSRILQVAILIINFFRHEFYLLFSPIK